MRSPFYELVGIIRDADDKLMTIVDTRYWTDRFNDISAEIIPYVDRVLLALNIDKKLRMPPRASENDKGEIIVR